MEASECEEADVTGDDWTVQILVPDDGQSNILPDPVREGGKVVEASVEALRANWRETIHALAAVGDGVDDETSSWGVAQIEVGLTLNAKGQLLFIAEASAEASVKVVLRRRERAFE